MSQKLDHVSPAFSTQWFSVDELHFNNPETSYYRINNPSGAVILPVTSEGNFILIRQFRHVLGEYTLEFPAGGLSPKEDPAEAALRELYEETGYKSDELILVGTGVIRVDREDANNYFFVAKDAYFDKIFECEEEIEIVEVSPTEFKTLVQTNKFAHIAALGIFHLAEWNKGMKLL